MTKTSEKGDGDQNKNVGHLVALTIGVFCRVVKAEAKSDFIRPSLVRHWLHFQTRAYYERGVMVPRLHYCKVPGIAL